MQCSSCCRRRSSSSSSSSSDTSCSNKNNKHYLINNNTADNTHANDHHELFMFVTPVFFLATFGETHVPVHETGSIRRE